MPARRLLPVVLAGVAIALTGCTAAPVPSSTPAAPVTAAARTTPAPAATPSATPSTTPAASAADRRYTALVRQLDPDLRTTSSTRLRALGQQACGGFADGRRPDAVRTAVAASDGIGAADAASVVSAAVATLCPAYRGELQQEADAD